VEKVDVSIRPELPRFGERHCLMGGGEWVPSSAAADGSTRAMLEGAFALPLMERLRLGDENDTSI